LAARAQQPVAEAVTLGFLSPVGVTGEADRRVCLLKRRSLAVIGARHCRRIDEGREAGRRADRTETTKFKLVTTL